MSSNSFQPNYKVSSTIGSIKSILGGLRQGISHNPLTNVALAGAGGWTSGRLLPAPVGVVGNLSQAASAAGDNIAQGVSDTREVGGQLADTARHYGAEASDMGGRYVDNLKKLDLGTVGGTIAGLGAAGTLAWLLSNKKSQAKTASAVMTAGRAIENEIPRLGTGKSWTTPGIPPGLSFGKQSIGQRVGGFLQANPIKSIVGAAGAAGAVGAAGYGLHGHEEAPGILDQAKDMGGRYAGQAMELGGRYVDNLKKLDLGTVGGTIAGLGAAGTLAWLLSRNSNKETDRDD